MTSAQWKSCMYRTYRILACTPTTSHYVDGALPDPCRHARAFMCTRKPQATGGDTSTTMTYDQTKAIQGESVGLESNSESCNTREEVLEEKTPVAEMESNDTTVAPGVQGEVHRKETEYSISEKYDAVVMQENDIREAIREAQPLIRQKEDPSVLLAEYETAASTGFQHGVMDLMQRYDAFRRVRGDGDCFFRSYIFSLLEEMLYGLKRGDAQVKKAHAGLIERVKGSKELLLQQNYQEVSFCDPLEAMVNILTKLEHMSASELENEFCTEGGTALWLIWFLRLITAAYLKANAERFSPFIGEDDVAAWCQREAEPMGKECEQVQIIALCEQMDVAVKIEYLDGKEFSECLSSVTIPDELAAMRSSMKPLTLLYRPGHYDILYDSRR